MPERESSVHNVGVTQIISGLQAGEFSLSYQVDTPNQMFSNHSVSKPEVSGFTIQASIYWLSRGTSVCIL